MKAYEYIRLEFDYGNLGPMNRLSSTGWRVVAVSDTEFGLFALMERELPTHAETLEEFIAGIPEGWDRNYCPVCKAFLAENGEHKPLCSFAAIAEMKKENI